MLQGNAIISNVAYVWRGVKMIICFTYYNTLQSELTIDTDIPRRQKLVVFSFSERCSGQSVA